MPIINVSAKSNSIRGSISLPASKSISNRLLIIRALAGHNFEIRNLSTADDTVLMQHLLLKIQQSKNSTKALELDCGNAGTVLRFLTALLAIRPGKWILTGSERMKQRPVGILVESLNQLGAGIQYVNKTGFPPLSIVGKELEGTEISMDGNISSQFVSALILIAPLLEKGLKINLRGSVSSRPYIEMTLGLLNKFGVNAVIDKNKISIPPQTYKDGAITVESDWSSASFWYEIAALSREADIRLENLSKDSLQGDSILPGIFEQLGVKTRFSNNAVQLIKTEKKTGKLIYDFTNHLDLALPVIVTAAALNIQGRFSGLENLRIKESDRLLAMVNELSKLGFKTELNEQFVLTTIPRKGNDDPHNFSKPVQTYADHRMAMAFAPLALVASHLSIDDPEVVAKSYPAFWSDLSSCGFDCKN